MSKSPLPPLMGSIRSEDPLMHTPKPGGVECRPLLAFRHINQLTSDAFVKANPSPVLLAFATGSDVDGDQTTSMQQTKVDAPRHPVLDLSRLTKQDLESINVHLLRKERTRFGEAIWIGRWMKCDICIERSTLSRLHAFLTTDAEGNVSLGDGGSKNGTFIDGNRVEKGATVQLPDDAYLTLGTVSVRFLQPRAFYRELHAALARFA